MDPEPSLTDELAGLSPRSAASDDVPGRSPRRYADEDDDEVLAAGLSTSGSHARLPDGSARPGKGSGSEASTPTADQKGASGAATPFDATLVSGPSLPHSVQLLTVTDMSVRTKEIRMLYMCKRRGQPH